MSHSLFIASHSPNFTLIIGAPIALALEVDADLVDPGVVNASHFSSAKTKYLLKDYFEAELLGALTVTNKLFALLISLIGLVFFT